MKRRSTGSPRGKGWTLREAGHWRSRALRGLGCAAALWAPVAGCVSREPSPDATRVPTPSGSTETEPAVATPHPPTVVPLSRTGPPRTCDQAAGVIESGSYPAAAVPGAVPYLIYLPPCYRENEQLYPTLYLLHGHPYDESHWMQLGAGEVADEGILNGDWPPFLMVMPLQPDPLFRNSDGGPGSYETEFMQGAVAFAEGLYRADPGRRALGGISRGGVWALEIGFSRPGEFQGLAAVSPALAVNAARPPYDPFQIARNAERLPPRILLLAGDTDWALPTTERLSGVLDAGGFLHSMVVVAGDHSDATWAEAMPRILGFLAQSVADGR